MAAQQPDDKAEGTDEQRSASVRGTSKRQVEANRENGRKAAGKKSPEGKAKSAQNATKHGIFVAKVEPLTKGPFAEDPEEFSEKVDALVAALAPRDALEVALAGRIAAIYNAFDRLERWANATLNGAARMAPLDYETGVGSGQARMVMAVNARRLLHYMEGRLPEEEALFDAFALMVRKYGPDPKIGVKGLWDEDHEPKSLEQWKSAYRSLIAHHWPNKEDALWWAWDLSERLARSYAQVDGLEEQLVAHRILDGPLDLQLKYHSRLRRELTEMTKQYAELQKRELAGKNEPNVTEGS